MKKQLLTFLSTCCLLSLCQINKITTVSCANLQVDYANDAYQVWQVQNNVKNLLMGNSIYTYYPGEVRLNDSIRIKKPTSNYLTLYLEFTESFDTYIIDDSCDVFFNLKDDNNKSFVSIATRLSVKEDINEDITDSKTTVELKNNGVFFEINATTASEYLTFYQDPVKYYNGFRFKFNANGGKGLLTKAMLYDGRITDYEYECPKLGTGANSEVIYNNGDSFNYTIDFDNLLTLDDILGNITAYDFFGKTEVEKVIVEDTYTEAVENRDLGAFSAKISATNINNVSSYITLNLNIIDKTAPVITGDKNITISYTEMPENGAVDLSKYIFGLDNHDGKINLDSNCITYYPTYFVQNVVNVSVTDSSNNKSEAKINLQVIDDVAPTIEGPEELTVYQYEISSINKLFERYTISDGGGSGIKKVSAINDNFSTNEGTPGDHSVTIKAIDNFGNETTKDVIVHVANTIGPVFFINAQSLDLTTSSLVSASEVVSLLMEKGNIPHKNYIKSEYITTTYEENYKKAGSYETEIVSYDKDGNADYYLVTLNVSKKKKTNAFKSMWTSICNFFEMISSFFKDIWRNFLSLFGK